LVKNESENRYLQFTAVARNFDWEGLQKKSCDVNLVTFFSDVITMTSLK